MQRKKKIVNNSVDLFTINNYTKVCKQLGIVEKKLENFDSLKEYRYHQILNIQKLFNGDNTTNYYYPYFRRLGSGLVFNYSTDYHSYIYFGQVTYYKNREISDFIGKTFIDIYTDLL